MSETKSDPAGVEKPATEKPSVPEPSIPERVEAIIAQLRAGEDYETWGSESGDPWGGWSRWGTIYRFRDGVFLSALAESTWHTGVSLKSDYEPISEELVRAQVEKDLREG